MHKSGFFSLAILIILGTLAVSSAKTAGHQDGLLHVYFFDIGQGDSIFIQAPNGNQILVDGGPDGKIIEKLAEVMPDFDRSLDAIILSHPHSDHMRGLIEVLDQYEVGAVIEAREDYDSAIFREWKETIAQEDTLQIEGIAGTVLDMGNDITLTVMHPAGSFEGRTLKEPHEANVTALLRYKEFELLLTGDMEDEGEHFLVAQGAPLDVDVLKVGHHGSKTSTTTQFLEATTPQVAVIQVGTKNRYGHPAPSVLTRLENSGIKYYRTDTDGDIRLTSDGDRYLVNTY